MKKIILILLCVCSVSVFAQDKQFNWKTNFEDARMASKDGNKPILVFFTNYENSESLKLHPKLIMLLRCNKKAQRKR